MTNQAMKSKCFTLEIFVPLNDTAICFPLAMQGTDIWKFLKLFNMQTISFNVILQCQLVKEYRAKGQGKTKL